MTLWAKSMMWHRHQAGLQHCLESICIFHKSDTLTRWHMCVRQVARLLALVPPWVRVYRIQRDIPMPLVTSGVEKGNLRELALARMGQLGLRCRDVRTREVGIQVSCPFLTFATVWS